MLYFSWI